MLGPRHLALISALALAVPAFAWGEPQGRGAPWNRGVDRGYDGRYGYNDYRYASRAGFQTGLNDGYEAGLNDARARRRYDPLSERRYRSADHGYERRYGSKDAYKLAYRDGFKDGYERGYRDGRRYDNRYDNRRRDRGFGGFLGWFF